MAVQQSSSGRKRCKIEEKQLMTLILKQNKSFNGRGLKDGADFNAIVGSIRTAGQIVNLSQPFSEVQLS
jgi:hypothetical protein